MVKFSIHLNRRVFVMMRKECFQKCAKCSDSDHAAYIQSIIQASALHSYILKYQRLTGSLNIVLDFCVWRCVRLVQSAWKVVYM